ncbi:MAG: sulfatase-like hydrolase/transferase [Planctomycetota bacterium]
MFIYSDDHANRAVGAYGAAYAPTPNIDRLAEQGLRFDRAFCTNSICAPARAVVLTGKHSHLNGVRDNEDRFDPASRTFPKLLQAAGYRTALFGKWHLKSHPTGFDEWQVLDGQGQYYQPEFFRPDGAGGVEKVRYDGHATEVTTRLAIDWLEARAGGGDGDSQPFLLMLQHKAPHRNWMPAPSELGLFAEGDLPEPATLFDDYAGRATGARDQEMTIARHLYLDYDLQLPGDPALATGPGSLGGGATGPHGPGRAGRVGCILFDPATPAYGRGSIQTSSPGKTWCAGSTSATSKTTCVASQASIAPWAKCSNGSRRTASPKNTLVIYTSDQGFYLGELGWYDSAGCTSRRCASARHALAGRHRAGAQRRAPGAEPRLRPHLLEGGRGARRHAGPKPSPCCAVSPAQAGATRSTTSTSKWASTTCRQAAYGVRTERHYKLIHYPGLDAPGAVRPGARSDEPRSRYGETGYAKIQAELTERLQRLREEVQRWTEFVRGVCLSCAGPDFASAKLRASARIPLPAPSHSVRTVCYVRWAARGPRIRPVRVCFQKRPRCLTGPVGPRATEEKRCLARAHNRVSNPPIDPAASWAVTTPPTSAVPLRRAT